MIANDVALPPSLNMAGKKPWEIPHVDTMELLKFGGGQAMTLDAACFMFGIASPKEGSLCASGVRDAFTKGNFEEIAVYCCEDVRATRALHQRITGGGLR